jgi:hypothetical protein
MVCMNPVCDLRELHAKPIRHEVTLSAQGSPSARTIPKTFSIPADNPNTTALAASGSQPASLQRRDAAALRPEVAMEGRFHPLSSSASSPRQASQFTVGFQQALGDDFDLDPLFLEESWTLGLPAAKENWERRQRDRADRERQNRAFRELDSFATFNFAEAAGWTTASLLADRAATIASRYDPNWSQPAPAAEIIAQPGADQQPGQAEAPKQHEAQPFAFKPCEAPSVPMTKARACILLEVDLGTTREQLRSAYRRMVSRWHPDRLQLCTDEIRRYANHQMAAINEAYSLLRANLQQEAA